MTDEFGSYRIFVAESGKGTVKIAFKTQIISGEIESYSTQVRFDLAIENKDGEITIKGESPNEYSVTKFGQSLEFSNGLFSNLNIETQREAAKTAVAETSKTPATAASTDPIVKPDVSGRIHSTAPAHGA